MYIFELSLDVADVAADADADAEAEADADADADVGTNVIEWPYLPQSGPPIVLTCRHSNVSVFKAVTAGPPLGVAAGAPSPP